MLSRLSLKDLRLMVSLGCESAERQITQPVGVTIEIEFSRVPEACQSDELEQTVCYDRISRAMTAHCLGKEFKLIERLGLELFHVAKEITGNQTAITLHLHKLHPPVENLKGGAVFSLSERTSWSS